MARPHFSATVENAFYAHVEDVLRARGWQERLIGYTGYGTSGQARVLARVLLSQERREPEDAEASPAAAAMSRQELEEADLTRRGWRAFVTAPAMNTPVRIQVGDASVVARTDRGGYIDTMVPGHGLDPGWHHAELSTINGDRVHVSCHIVDPEARLGVISDIDDTVMITHLPRPLIAAWNTFVRSEQRREEVPGMASFYRSLLAQAPGTPIFYVSTGAWNTAPTLTRFLRRHDFPMGPLLLTDWGPTNTGWFRSGQMHKSSQLHRLAREFPQCRWIMVGDDGQHDPTLYGDFAQALPEAVEVIAIRKLTPAQQILSHGLPVATDELVPSRSPTPVPMLRAADGFTLHTLVQSARQRLGRLKPSAWVPSSGH
ncbi:MAG TPA: phosphatase domain-containing protein [Ornithinimicrobium sp.]|uniref:App1 family protein n=1 Tax=Ornithinimicrobium sp. TaxID=1977084 RepID=UPI002B49468E|nr:phosphatase domain-containing protein [Ornithinimicrobium sp.]HKJ11436.1 phosphatase domain-containing protein [Ornithinimicrobium sp.]